MQLKEFEIDRLYYCTIIAVQYGLLTEHNNRKACF